MLYKIGKLIRNLFKSAFIKVSDVKDNDNFSVVCDSLDIDIALDKKRRFIRFSAFYKIDDIPYEESLLKSNDYNLNYIMARYCVDKYENDAFLVADYMISFEMGIIPFQIVNSARLLEKYTIGTFREFFSIE